MKAENDKEDGLQKVLALKRHETPPPRFFKGFSHQVIDRLDSPEPPLTWQQKICSHLESKLFLVCATAVAVFGLLAIGIISSMKVEPPKASSRTALDQERSIATPTPSPMNAPEPGLVIPAERVPVGEPVLISQPSSFQNFKPALERATLNSNSLPPATGPR
jgi:hypothetical protein